MTAVDPRVGEIENRLAATTPGYWEYEVGSGNVFNDQEDPDLIANVENSRDGVFLRSAASDVAYLLAELRKRDEALARVEDLCQTWKRLATTDNTHDTTLRAVVYAIRASAAVTGDGA